MFLFPSDLSSSPRQSFTHRTMADMLPTTLRSSSFELLMRWLRLPALATLWPVLPVNHLHAAFCYLESVEYEIFRKKERRWQPRL
ncbi:hypothetical protein DMH27_17045 [Raoultella planticola]|nr:hypothetical protein [Raoultella planticola]